MPLPGAEKRSLVENALGKLASELTGRKLQAADMPEILTNYLKKFPYIYGATLAFAPNEEGGQKHIAAPYVYHSGGEFRQVDLPDAYDYTKSEWFAEPVKGKAPYWCNPYYDEGGGGIVMVTYSIPLYDNSGNLVGVLTSDLEAGQK
jgi:sigma-B regulation protein RsbU (phosphoserine phosphatase)